MKKYVPLKQNVMKFEVFILDYFLMIKGQYPYFMFFFCCCCFCSNVFLYVSTGYISIFRDWMQLYLEI